MPLTFLLVICILFLLVFVFLVIQKNKADREFQELMNYDSSDQNDKEQGESDDMAAGMYAARSALRKAAILKEEGQIDQAVYEIKKVQEMQANRDKLYFTSFKKLIQDNIAGKKYVAASKFLDKYENMLGTSSQKQYSLVSYVPFKELYLMKYDVALGQQNGTEALKFSLISDWFSFRENYERPLNVLNFAYNEFITYIKQLNGGVISKKYLPKITTYLAGGMPSMIDPVDFLNTERLDTIIRSCGLETPLETLKRFIRTGFYYTFEDFRKTLDTLFTNGKMREWKTGIHLSDGTTGNEVQEAFNYALQHISQRDIYVMSGTVENGRILYANANNEMVDCRDIVLEFFEKEELGGSKLPYNVFNVLYILLYWDILHGITGTDAPTREDSSNKTSPAGFLKEMYRQEFYNNHASEFASREVELLEGDLMEEIVRCIADNRNKPWPARPTIRCDSLDLDHINHTIKSFDRTSLLNLLQLLANEFRLHKTFPDLYLFPVKDGEGKFVAVKHAEQPFTENELFWILNLHYNLRLPVEIVTVRIGTPENQ